MYDWNDLQFVIALNEAGTMKRAAELLKTDPTTVSRHIKRLSEKLDVMIFLMQKGGKWELTKEGEQLLEFAIEFKNRYERLHGELKNGERLNTIKITSIEFLLTNYLAPELGSFTGRFPKARVELIGADKRLSLAYGEADLALRFGRPQEGSLIASKIAEIQMLIWAPEGYIGHDWVGLSADLDWTPEMQAALERFGRQPSVRVTSYAAARNAAEILGIAAVGPNATMGQSTMMVPLTEQVPTKREVWSVIHESRRMDSQLSIVRDWVKQAVVSRQAALNQTVNTPVVSVC